MGQEEVVVWFAIVFAVLVAAALIVASYRAHKRRQAPVVRIDRELAKERASRPPRRQHYAFAHQRLRDALLATPAQAFARVTAEDASDFLVALWSACATDEEDAISSEGIRTTVEDDVAVIALPPPSRTSEAYMIGVTRTGEYFVLERGEEKAFLAEWKSDMRVRYGSVPTPSRREMVLAIREVLAGRAARTASAR